MKVKNLNVLSTTKYPDYKLKNNVFLIGLLTAPISIPFMAALIPATTILKELEKEKQKRKYLNNEPLKYSKERKEVKKWKKYLN